jgi:hypothetical protein
MPTNDFPMVDVQSIRPLDGCRLWVRFTDGSEGVRERLLHRDLAT